MLFFKDFKSKKTGKWYTIRPLNMFDREELTRRFNFLDKQLSIREQLLLDNDGEKTHHIEQMLALYDISLSEVDITEIDNLFVEYIIPVNFDPSKLKKVIRPQAQPQLKVEQDNEVLAKVLNTFWSATESAGEALYMVNNLPAELALNILMKRIDTLKSKNMTEEDKRKQSISELKHKLIDEYSRSKGLSNPNPRDILRKQRPF